MRDREPKVPERAARLRSAPPPSPIAILGGPFTEDENMARLDGKVALVTGAARGTGEATARRFAAEGAQVVLADLRDDQGEAVAKELGDAARYVHLDVTDEEGWTRAVDASLGHFGRLDVLVNNAGLLHLAATSWAPSSASARSCLP